MKQYGIHVKPQEQVNTLYIVDASQRPDLRSLGLGTIHTLVGVEDAETPIDAAKKRIGERSGKVAVIDVVEEMSAGVTKVAYTWRFTWEKQ